MVRDDLLHAFFDNLHTAGGLVIMEISRQKRWGVCVRVCVRAPSKQALFYNRKISSEKGEETHTRSSSRHEH